MKGRHWGVDGQTEPSIGLYFKRALSKRKEKKRILSLFFHLPKLLSSQSPHLPAFTRTWVKLKMCFTQEWRMVTGLSRIAWWFWSQSWFPLQRPSGSWWCFSKEMKVGTSGLTLMEDFGHGYQQGFYSCFPCPPLSFIHSTNISWMSISCHRCAKHWRYNHE